MNASKSAWVEELPAVLWVYQTTTKSSTSKTSLLPTYGSEAVTPIESQRSPRIDVYEEKNNGKSFEALELLNEKRIEAANKMTRHQRMDKRFINWFRLRTLKVWVWVLQQVFQNTQVLNAEKLALTWEGLHIIHQVVGNGAYRLKSVDEKVIPNTSNIKYLKKILLLVEL